MDDTLTQTLSLNEAVLWQQYLNAERQGVRKLVLQSLKNFVEALQVDSAAQRDTFAKTFCQQMVDEGKALPLREPLFADIIGPYLISSYQNDDSNAGRWLAYYHLYFLNISSARKLINLVGPLSPIALLTEAFRRAPNHARTREMLIEKLANQFEYAVHEVPSGVLYSQNAATVAECQKRQDRLNPVPRSRAETRCARKYAEEMRYWDFHFRGYADYLTNQQQYQNYAEYINQHWQV